MSAPLVEPRKNGPKLPALTPAFVADRLAASGAAICSLVRGADRELGRWRPEPERWSMVEVLCHLYDAECADFWPRFELILCDGPFTPIDPEGWARDRRYREQNLGKVVDAFRQLRAERVSKLRKMGDVELTTSRRTPTGGTLSAGGVLAAWVDHDLLHLRQLLNILHAHTVQRSAPFDVGYAGTW